MQTNCNLTHLYNAVKPQSTKLWHNHLVTSNGPLDIVFFYVWDPASFYSINGFSYYVICTYHYSKYLWLYMVKHKLDVSFHFLVFKSLVEKQSQSRIKTLYSNKGIEYINLCSFLQQHGITHMTTPPYALKHNGLFKCKHLHQVKIT
ncbi:hypothetical protein CR513_53898, partial [Mucuna pruriens]